MIKYDHLLDCNTWKGKKNKKLLSGGDCAVNNWTVMSIFWWRGSKGRNMSTDIKESAL